MINLLKHHLTTYRLKSTQSFIAIMLLLSPLAWFTYLILDVNPESIIDIGINNFFTMILPLALIYSSSVLSFFLSNKTFLFLIPKSSLHILFSDLIASIPILLLYSIMHTTSLLFFREYAASFAFTSRQWLTIASLFIFLQCLFNFLAPIFAIIVDRLMLSKKYRVFMLSGPHEQDATSEIITLIFSVSITNILFNALVLTDNKSIPPISQVVLICVLSAVMLFAAAYLLEKYYDC